MRELLRRTRYWLRRGRLDAELAEELEHHRRLKARELERRGLSPSEAAVEARRALGNKLVARARARDVWIWPWLQDVSQDIASGRGSSFEIGGLPSRPRRRSRSGLAPTRRSPRSSTP